MKTVVLTALLLAALPAAGQNWETLTQSRRTSGEDHLLVHVEHAAGDLRVHPGATGQLYRIALRYDEALFTPRVRYAPTGASLRVEMDGNQRRHNVNWDDDMQSLDLTLTPDVPLDLELKFGAARADLDLGGLLVRSLVLETGASESRLSFDSPNAGECTRMEMSVGAAEFTATQLGNARCRRVTVEAGVGDLLLDFGGDMPDGFASHVSVKVGLGGVEIHIPESVGVRLTVRRFLASVERAGFVRVGDGWETPNYDTATRTIRLDVQAALGSIEIIRIPDST